MTLRSGAPACTVAERNPGEVRSLEDAALVPGYFRRSSDLSLHAQNASHGQRMPA